MKNVVKAIYKDGKVFQYLKQECPCIIEAKIKEGIPVFPQIKYLIRGSTFNLAVNDCGNHTYHML
jgi:hypothetical protein